MEQETLVVCSYLLIQQYLCGVLRKSYKSFVFCSLGTLIKDRNGLPVEPVRLLPPAASRLPSSAPFRPSTTPEVQRKRKLDDLTPRIDTFLASKRPKPEEDIATDTATKNPPFSMPVTNSAASPLSPAAPPSPKPVAKRSVELAFSVGKCGDAWRERRPERLPGNAVILGRLDHANLVRVHFFLTEHRPEMYRDYPRPPRSLLLHKEYFDCPQRDSHAVHYI